MNADGIRFVVGIIGNVISICLFTSPIPTFVAIIKQKSVQEFKPDPYVATVLNCSMWVFYGMPFVHPDSLLVVTINGAGLAIEAIYVSIFFIYSTNVKRKRICLALLVELVFFIIIVFITLYILHGTKSRSMLVGILCIIFNVVMYASPLTVMHKVIKTKSVKYMPFLLSFASFCNGSIWLTYALIKFDIYISIPNGLGALFGLAQLILYATFYRTTNWKESGEGDGSKPSETEMNKLQDYSSAEMRLTYSP